MQYTHSPFWHFPTNTGEEGRTASPSSLQPQHNLHAPTQEPSELNPELLTLGCEVLLCISSLHRCPLLAVFGCTCVLPNQGYATCFLSQQPSDVLSFPRIRSAYFIAMFSTGLGVILLNISKLTMQTGRRAIIQLTLRNK